MRCRSKQTLRDRPGLARMERQPQDGNQGAGGGSECVCAASRPFHGTTVLGPRPRVSAVRLGLFCCRPGDRRMLMWGGTFRVRGGRVPVLTTLATPDSFLDLRAVTVRPTRGAREHRLWDRRVKEHPYLRFPGIIGTGLRPVARHGETWVAQVSRSRTRSRLLYATAGLAGLRGRSSGACIGACTLPGSSFRARGGRPNLRRPDLGFDVSESG